MSARGSQTYKKFKERAGELQDLLQSGNEEFLGHFTSTPPIPIVQKSRGKADPPETVAGHLASSGLLQALGGVTDHLAALSSDPGGLSPWSAGWRFFERLLEGVGEWGKEEGEGEDDPRAAAVAEELVPIFTEYLPEKKYPYWLRRSVSEVLLTLSDTAPATTLGLLCRRTDPDTGTINDTHARFLRALAEVPNAGHFGLASNLVELYLKGARSEDLDPADIQPAAAVAAGAAAAAVGPGRGRVSLPATLLAAAEEVQAEAQQGRPRADEDIRSFVLDTVLELQEEAQGQRALGRGTRSGGAGGAGGARRHRKCQNIMTLTVLGVSLGTYRTVGPRKGKKDGQRDRWVDIMRDAGIGVFIPLAPMGEVGGKKERAYIELSGQFLTPMEPPAGPTPLGIPPDARALVYRLSENFQPAEPRGMGPDPSLFVGQEDRTLTLYLTPEDYEAVVEAGLHEWPPLEALEAPAAAAAGPGQGEESEGPEEGRDSEPAGPGAAAGDMGLWDNGALADFAPSAAAEPRQTRARAHAVADAAEPRQSRAGAHAAAAAAKAEPRRTRARAAAAGPGLGGPGPSSRSQAELPAAGTVDVADVSVVRIGSARDGGGGRGRSLRSGRGGLGARGRGRGAVAAEPDAAAEPDLGPSTVASWFLQQAAGSEEEGEGEREVGVLVERGRATEAGPSRARGAAVTAAAGAGFAGERRRPAPILVGPPVQQQAPQAPPPAPFPVPPPCWPVPAADSDASERHEALPQAPPPPHHPQPQLPDLVLPSPGPWQREPLSPSSMPGGSGSSQQDPAAAAPLGAGSGADTRDARGAGAVGAGAVDSLPPGDKGDRMTDEVPRPLDSFDASEPEPEGSVRHGAALGVGAWAEAEVGSGLRLRAAPGPNVAAARGPEGQAGDYGVHAVRRAAEGAPGAAGEMEPSGEGRGIRKRKRPEGPEGPDPDGASPRPEAVPTPHQGGRSAPARGPRGLYGEGGSGVSEADHEEAAQLPVKKTKGPGPGPGPEAGTDARAIGAMAGAALMIGSAAGAAAAAAALKTRPPVLVPAPSAASGRTGINPKQLRHDLQQKLLTGAGQCQESGANQVEGAQMVREVVAEFFQANISPWAQDLTKAVDDNSWSLITGSLKALFGSRQREAGDKAALLLNDLLQRRAALPARVLPQLLSDIAAQGDAWPLICCLRLALPQAVGALIDAGVPMTTREEVRVRVPQAQEGGREGRRGGAPGEQAEAEAEACSGAGVRRRRGANRGRRRRAAAGAAAGGASEGGAMEDGCPVGAGCAAAALAAATGDARSASGPSLACFVWEAQGSERDPSADPRAYDWCLGIVHGACRRCLRPDAEGQGGGLAAVQPRPGYGDREAPKPVPVMHDVMRCGKPGCQCGAVFEAEALSHARACREEGCTRPFCGFLRDMGL